MCEMTWREQEARRGDHAWQSGLSLSYSSPGLLSQTFTEGLSVPQLWSCTRKLGLHRRLCRDKFREESKLLCSNWISCNREVQWACLQCHPVGTARALLVLLRNAPGKIPLPAMLQWGASDAINHRAQEIKSLRKTWASLHLVLVNKIHSLEE